MAFGPNVVCKEIQAISTNFRHNEQIRISPIRLINDKEEQVGIISTSEALRMAREAALDLVEVAPNARPPVCRIMDYGKWRYQQQKKEDKSRASNKGGRLKQINIDTIRIGENDLGIKINRARDFLKEGNKVQFTLRFKGREMAHLDLGRNLFIRIKTELFLVSKIERDAKMEGKRMTLVLQPDHKDPSKLPVPKAAPAKVGSGLNLPPRPVGAPGVGPGIAPRPIGAPGIGAPGIVPRPVGAPGAVAPGAAPGVAPRPASAPVAPRPPIGPASIPRPAVAPVARPAVTPTPATAPATS